MKQNVINHKVKGYSVVMISLKPPGKPPGDMNAIQMNELSLLSHDYSFGEIRVTHEQNILLPHVENKKMYDLWLKLKKIGLSTPNIGLISDIICCPGMDYCALATARSIPISQKISHLLIAVLLLQSDILIIISSLLVVEFPFQLHPSQVAY